MVLEEFAVVPSVINEWSDLKIMSLFFGFQNGAVIPTFPRNWMSYLKTKAANELKDSDNDEYNRVTERLNYLKDNCLIRSGRDYDTQNNKSWIENALTQHKIAPFYKIICNEDTNGSPDVIKFEKLDARLLSGLRAGKYKRNAETLANNARLLLLASKHIKIVDPYFTYKKGYKHTLEQIISVSDLANRQNIADFTINTSSIRGKNEINIENERKKFIDMFGQIIPEGKSITFNWWNDNLTKEIHPRYLLTERGGIRYDRGFQEPHDLEEREHKTDISMMTQQETNESWNQYTEELSHFKIVRTLTLKGQ